MNVYQIIEKKRDGAALTSEEIDYIIQGYSQNKIPDYQMSALVMAIYLRGMDFGETAAMTRAMLESGIRMNFSSMPGFKVDKHSTGGVGDKVSLILAPLVAAAGLRVPMISGRGLGHSGGTLDKLDAIPGFRTRLSADEFYQQIEDIGVSMIGQTEHIAPADRKMYALRDATVTIESIPLITASILSKKLAEGIDGLVLDVKTGKGAFMSSQEDASALAHSLVKTAKLNGLPTRALITRMDEPLGKTAGNWLETREAIDCLQGQGPDDLMQVTLKLAAQMLLMSGLVISEDEAMEKLGELIDSGVAFQKFCDLVQRQGGDLSFVHNPERYPKSVYEHSVTATRDGFVVDMDALSIGRSVVSLGGGRQVMEDQIDYKAGVVLLAKVGDAVANGDTVAVLYTDKKNAIDSAAAVVADAVKIESKEPIKKNLIIELISG
jgi:pyrimidine-nucleoside phosphorylase